MAQKGLFFSDDDDDDGDYLVSSVLETTLHPQNHNLNIHSCENLISIIF
jgi:hypothetical protein